jgi:hypothetical protein
VAHDVYDVDGHNRVAPDPLGVLGHYKAVVWYTGNDLFIREPEAPGGTGTSKLALDEINNVRDYLNEGGKLLYTGQNAAFGQLTGFNYNPGGQPPYCNVAELDPQPSNMIDNARCALLNDDFLQYWLGAYVHINAANSKAAASALPMSFTGGPFGTDAFALNGPTTADNQVHTYSMVTTSSILPPDRYPQFKSQPVATFDRQPAFEPFGSHYMYAKSKDEAWQRLTKTIDLTGKTSGSLGFNISYDTEDTFDYVVVEAHTVGEDDWTTLEEDNEGTAADVGQSCDINWDTLHPFLTHYQTNTDKSQDAEDADCEPVGTEGTPPGRWFGATGNSAGWQDWSFDLSAYAGKQVEVSISYIQDFAADGLGVFVDNAKVTADDVVVETADFENDMGGWTAAPPPSPDVEPEAGWQRATSVGFQEGPAVTTADTVYYGFGIEGMQTAAARAKAVGSALQYLGLLSAAGASPPQSGASPPQSGGSPATQPAASAKKARTSINSPSRLRVDSKGRVAVRVACQGDSGATCGGAVRVLHGRVAAAKAAGSKKFRIDAGKTATVRVTLTKAALRSLKRHKLLRMTLSIAGTDSSGAKFSSRKIVRLLAPKKAARR